MHSSTGLSQRQEYVRGSENHINRLEGFWGYLKRKLAAKKVEFEKTA
jgi:hypothetical protein